MPAASVVVLRPRVRRGRMIAVDVYSISADVLVISVAAVSVVAAVLCVRLVVVAAVVSAVIIGVVVAIAVVVAAVVVAAVPGGVSVVGPSVVHHRGAMPATVPTAIAPTAAPASAAHQCSDCDSSSEPDNGSGSHVAGAVSGSYIGRAINDGGVVLRNVHNLRVSGLNDNDLRRLLHHGDLRAGLEIACGFGLCAQSLDGCHDLRLLAVIGLSKRGSPGEVI